LAAEDVRLTDSSESVTVRAAAAEGRGYVAAAIVVYRPDPRRLGDVVAAVSGQVNELVLIANDGAPWSCALPANATLAVQGKNVGLGAAYNRAAEWARRRGAAHLLLLDQDSVPAPGMVKALADALERPGRIAAAGPLWRDSRTGEDGFFVRHAPWGTRKYRPRAGEVAAVDFLISSGSLIPLAALDEIGPFDEDLFIDHVDSDWTLRARAKGYRLCGVADARLDHTIGESTMSIWLSGPKLSFFSYSPDRNYYLVRNSIAMWRRPYVSWRWVLHDVCRTIAITSLHVLCVTARGERLRAINRAVRDAVGRGIRPSLD
jgi:rhamnosyltransferase